MFVLHGDNNVDKLTEYLEFAEQVFHAQNGVGVEQLLHIPLIVKLDIAITMAVYAEHRNVHLFLIDVVQCMAVKFVDKAFHAHNGDGVERQQIMLLTDK